GDVADQEEIEEIEQIRDIRGADQLPLVACELLLPFQQVDHAVSSRSRSRVGSLPEAAPPKPAATVQGSIGAVRPLFLPMRPVKASLRHVSAAGAPVNSPMGVGFRQQKTAGREARPFEASVLLAAISRGAHRSAATAS